MNLPFLKRFNKKILPSYFLVLILRDEKAEAVIFEEREAVVKIIGQQEEQFSSSIDTASQEELLEILDKAISGAEASLPENIQTQKTIFGVKESWTDKDQIKKEYLTKLKKTSEELGLVPIGFLVISQAIAHLLQKEEGAPVSAILTEINKESVTVTLLRAGKTVETKSSEIHETIPFTVDTLLKHFDIPEILPSRIIIFNGKEDLSQKFISHTWSKSLPFLHLPQIHHLPHGFDAKAVLFGAATQMGFEVLEKGIPSPPKLRLGAAGGTKEPHIEIANSPPAGEENFIETSDFGFVKDIDIAKMPASPRFAESRRERGEPTPQSSNGQDETEEIQKKENVDENILQISQEKYVPTKTKLPETINILFSVLMTLLMFVRKINIKKISSFIPKGKLGIIIPLILVLAIALAASYSLLLRATITITIEPKITQQEKTILFSTTKITNANKNIIKGEFVSVSEDGSTSTAATGKKDVGTNAKGTVTIFNSLSQSKTLAEGTIIKSPNGLEFTLDSSVTIRGVASRSADEPPPPSQTSIVNVTANQLGKESNLPSGTKLNISSFDITDLIAKNDNPFSGGTKKEITVVSKTDQDKLETDLPKQLENKAREKLVRQIKEDKVLLPVFVSSSISKKSMNAKVGDETNQLTLTGTVEYQGLSYDKKDLAEFSKFFLAKDIPSNQTVDYNNVKASVLDIKNENSEDLEAKLNIKALLLPKISENNLIKDLKGKSFKITEDLLYKLPQIADVKIKLFPNLPFLPKNLPSREKNIKIKILING